MKKIISIIFLLLITISVSHAERSIQGFTSFDEYRQLGEYRYWTFVAKDSVIGSLLSSVTEEITINDISGYVIEQRLKLDYSKISTDLIFDIINSHYVANDGMYLGDKMKISINDETEEAELKRDGSELSGYMTRGGNELDQKVDLGEIKYTFENNYIDDLELFLASRDITIGTQIDDTIFMAQSMIKSQIYGIVEDFRNIRLYNEVFDSAFVIEFTYPTMMTVYFTPDKRLVKLEIPSQELKIYQDAVVNPLKAKLPVEKSASQSQNQPIQKALEKPILPIVVLALLYIIVGVIITLFFVGAFYKDTTLNGFVLVGAGIFIIIPFTQIPLQEYLFIEYFVPHVIKAGESALVWGFFPASTAGFIQEIIKLLAILLVVNTLKLKKNQFLSIGAVIGLGFGLSEAIFLTYGAPSVQYFGFHLVERIFMLVFHVSAGMYLGFAVQEGKSKIIWCLLLTIVINSLFRYLPILVQNKTLTPQLLGILLAFIAILFVVYVLFITKRK